MGQAELTCILCPQGCQLTVAGRDGEWAIAGNACARGEGYALSEATDPRRVVTATIAVTGAVIPRLPVRTAGAVPKGCVLPLVRELHRLTRSAPVRLGEIILPDALGTGVAVVASRSLPAG